MAHKLALYLGRTKKDKEIALKRRRIQPPPITAGKSITQLVDDHFLAYNAGRTAGLADGVVITPSHNPPEDGGFKYNPPNGGPADTDITAAIEQIGRAHV